MLARDLTWKIIVEELRGYVHYRQIATPWIVIMAGTSMYRL